MHFVKDESVAMTTSMKSKPVKADNAAPGYNSEHTVQTITCICTVVSVDYLIMAWKCIKLFVLFSLKSLSDFTFS